MAKKINDLKELSKLLENGVITKDEFEKLKSEILTDIENSNIVPQTNLNEKKINKNHFIILTGITILLFAIQLTIIFFPRIFSLWFYFVGYFISLIMTMGIASAFNNSQNMSKGVSIFGGLVLFGSIVSFVLFLVY